MKNERPYRRMAQMGSVALIIVAIVIVVIYLFLRRWEVKLIQERETVCRERAALIARQVENDLQLQGLVGLLLHGDTINLASSRMIEEELTEVVEKKVGDTEGLEGGFYILGLDDFIGYAYPTSEPPVPAYGPPPRSYNIIREQVLASIGQNSALLNLHAFDPAVFPLATHPISIKGQSAGAVWVRIHIERDLPVAKLRQVLYVVTAIFGAGFVVMALFTLFLRSGIRSIRQELINTSTDPGYRLKLQGGIFGFIPRRINEMLDMIEDEYRQRLELEKQLQHKEKLASLGKMIAGVAHEVRTPLSVIKTRIQMWETAVRKNNGGGEGMDPETMEKVIGEINRVSDLLKRLVVFSRPIYDHMKPASVDAIIEEVLSMMDFNTPGKAVRVTRNLQEGPWLVLSDPNSLKQVFINIFTNAMESVEDGGEIVVETLYVPGQGRMTIRVSDNGSGISEEVLEHVFDPFFTTREKGTGLGLAISNEIIISHGGKISFGKNEPRGTICFITLPLTKEKL